MWLLNIRMVSLLVRRPTPAPARIQQSACQRSDDDRANDFTGKAAQDRGAGRHTVGTVPGPGATIAGVVDAPRYGLRATRPNMSGGLGGPSGRSFQLAPSTIMSS